MKIAICGSLNFTYEIQALAEDLRQRGFEVRIPLTSERILRGEVSLEEIKAEKLSGRITERVIKNDSIRAYCEVIKNSDAILVANYDKNGVKNYIGGNSFLEMGYAHILEKPIFVLNDIPDLSYTDEIREMQPIVLKGDLDLLK
jgi:nucleoside 2-deoxyribosyltransferase